MPRAVAGEGYTAAGVLVTIGSMPSITGRSVRSCSAIAMQHDDDRHGGQKPSGPCRLTFVYGADAPHGPGDRVAKARGSSRPPRPHSLWPAGRLR